MSTNAQESRELTRDEVVFAFDIILGRVPCDAEVDRKMGPGAVTPIAGPCRRAGPGDESGTQRQTVAQKGAR